METTSHYNGESLLSRKDVERITNLSRSEIYELMKLGIFPLPCKRGRKKVSWVASEIDKYVRSLISQRDAEHD